MSINKIPFSFLKFKKIFDFPFVIFLSISFLVIYFLHDHYGISYDEEVHKNYGNFILYFYESFGKNPSALIYRDLFNYGGFFDVLTQSIVHLFSLIGGLEGIHELRHIVNGWIGLLGYYFLYRIGETIYSRTVGILAVLFLLAIPEYTGHLFFNPKDIPFSSFYLGALYFFFRFFRENENPRKWFVLFVVFTGLAIGIRILGILLWPIFILGIGIKLYNRKGLSVSTFRNWIISSVCFLLGSYFVTVLFWPFLLRKPTAGLIQVFKTMSSFPWNGTVLTAGKDIIAPEIGRAYLPIFFSYTLPDWFFLLLIVSIAAVGWYVWKLFQNKGNLEGRKKYSFFLSSETFLLAAAGFGALLIIFVKKPVLYNGYRQVFFLIPPIILVLTAISWEFLNRFPKKTISAICILFFLLLLDTWVIMVRMHPYEYVYFNRTFAGGMKKGSELFDVEYWATSLKEGSLWLKEDLKNDPKQVKVASCASAQQTDYYLNPKEYLESERGFINFARSINLKNLFSEENFHTITRFEMYVHSGKQKFQYEGTLQNADYLLTTRLYHIPERFSGEIVHTVERMGIPILYVMKKK